MAPDSGAAMDERFKGIVRTNILIFVSQLAGAFLAAWFFRESEAPLILIAAATLVPPLVACLGLVPCVRSAVEGLCAVSAIAAAAAFTAWVVEPHFEPGLSWMVVCGAGALCLFTACCAGMEAECVPGARHHSGLYFFAALPTIGILLAGLIWLAAWFARIRPRRRGVPVPPMTA